MADGNPFGLKDEDAMKLLICDAHIGGRNVDHQCQQYVWKRRNDGVYIINIKKTWDKLYMAARAIAAIENPADVCVISARPYAQRALLKFAAHTGTTPIFGRFTPGSLTNQIQKNFKEPRLLVISDPRVDHQAVTEASYVNIPVISFCNTDSPMKYIDIGIPCNNKGQYSVGLMWWLLAREVLILRGKINRQIGFVLEDKVIMPDLYFYRDPQEQEKEDQTETRDTQGKEGWANTMDNKVDDFAIPAAPGEAVKLDFTVPQIDDWAAASTWNPTQIPTGQDATGQAAGTGGDTEWGTNTNAGW
jgi:small subunit ribosomal protein SAe